MKRKLPSAFILSLCLATAVVADAVLADAVVTASNSRIGVYQLRQDSGPDSSNASQMTAAVESVRAIKIRQHVRKHNHRGAGGDSASEDDETDGMRTGADGNGTNADEDYYYESSVEYDYEVVVAKGDAERCNEVCNAKNNEVASYCQAATTFVAGFMCAFVAAGANCQNFITYVAFFQGLNNFCATNNVFSPNCRYACGDGFSLDDLKAHFEELDAVVDDVKANLKALRARSGRKVEVGTKNITAAVKSLVHAYEIVHRLSGTMERVRMVSARFSALSHDADGVPAKDAAFASVANEDFAGHVLDLLLEMHVLMATDEPRLPLLGLRSLFRLDEGWCHPDAIVALEEVVFRLVYHLNLSMQYARMASPDVAEVNAFVLDLRRKQKMAVTRDCANVTVSNDLPESLLLLDD